MMYSKPPICIYIYRENNFIQEQNVGKFKNYCFNYYMQLLKKQQLFKNIKWFKMFKSVKIIPFTEANSS